MDSNLLKNNALSDFWSRHKFSSISIIGYRGENEKEDKDSFYFTSNTVYNLFFSLGERLSLGKRIQDESLNLTSLMDKHNDFDKISEFLFQKFKLDDFGPSGSLEKAIVKRINKLKNYDKTYLLINYIRTELMSLRKEKIEFWEKILQKYRLSKSEFDQKLLNDLGKFDFELEKAIREFPENLEKFEKRRMRNRKPFS